MENTMIIWFLISFLFFAAELTIGSFGFFAFGLSSLFVSILTCFEYFDIVREFSYEWHIVLFGVLGIIIVFFNNKKIIMIR